MENAPGTHDPQSLMQHKRNPGNHYGTVLYLQEGRRERGPSRYRVFNKLGGAEPKIFNPLVYRILDYPSTVLE